MKYKSIKNQKKGRGKNLKKLKVQEDREEQEEQEEQRHGKVKVKIILNKSQMLPINESSDEEEIDNQALESQDYQETEKEEDIDSMVAPSLAIKSFEKEQNLVDGAIKFLVDKNKEMN